MVEAQFIEQLRKECKLLQYIIEHQIILGYSNSYYIKLSDKTLNIYADMRSTKENPYFTIWLDDDEKINIFSLFGLCILIRYFI